MGAIGTVAVGAEVGGQMIGHGIKMRQRMQAHLDYIDSSDEWDKGYHPNAYEGVDSQF